MYAGISTTIFPNTTVRYKRLNIGGLDVLGNGTRFETPLDSIDLTEAGPGGVSSLSFTIWDPLIEVTAEEGALVEFWDIANNRPLFLGFLQTLTLRYSKAPGRWIDVDCIGIECLLDWMKVPDTVQGFDGDPGVLAPFFIPTNTHMASAIQCLVANATGVGFGIRAFSQPSGSEDYGSQAYPVAGIAPHFPTIDIDTDISNMSLREACKYVIENCNTWSSSGGAYVTIDFYGGLRLYNGNGPVEGPSGSILTISPSSDYSDFNITNTATSTYLSASSMVIRLDSASVVRGAYIAGGTAAGSGLVSDGRGVAGPVDIVTDSTSTTATRRNLLGAAHLGGFSQSVRATATFDLMTVADLAANNWRPGSYLYVLVDSQVMSATTLFSLFSITKKFLNGGNESWTVDFGGFAPSSTRRQRQLDPEFWGR